jgi:polysaccharide biosynthesis/export protein
MKLILGRIVSTCSLLLTIVLLATGCATTSEPAFTSGPALELETKPRESQGTEGRPGAGAGVSEYKFKQGDLVIVTFSGTPETFPPHQERIKEDGKITLTYIGGVKAEGKTAGELQKEIHDLFVPKYYVRMTVVVVPPMQDLFYHVAGEVRAPGPRPHLVGTTLTKAISSAGGLTDFARKTRITVTRANGTKITVDYNKAVDKSDADIRIQPDDRIHVPRRRF